MAAGRRTGRGLAGGGARAASRRRARRWSRCRCCSRRGWRGSTTRRSRSSPTRTCDASARRAAGTRCEDARAARQLSQEEKARRATFVVRNDGSEAGAERHSCRPCLTLLEDERERSPSTSRRARSRRSRTSAAVAPLARGRTGRRAAGARAGAAARRGGGRRAGGRVRSEPRPRGAQAGAAAQRRERHPRTGRRQAPGPGADRGGDLRRDEVRPAHLPGRRGGADADPARDRRIPGQALGRVSLHDQRPRHARAINVAYGSYYLRYLLDHYDGNEMLAVAAYNAGLANVDGWVAQGARRRQAADGRRDPVRRRRAHTCSACCRRSGNTGDCMRAPARVSAESAGLLEATLR